MASSLPNTLYEYLAAAGIRVSRGYLKAQLQSHPHYPSLACVTDILDELGIDNISLVADRTRLPELPIPFLTHDGRDFLLVKDLHRQFFEQPATLESWDGIVVLIENKPGWKHVANDAALATERSRFLRQFSSVVLLAMLFLVAAAPFSNYSFSQYVLYGAGLLFSVWIVQRDLGFSNTVSRRLCEGGSTSGCDQPSKHKNTGKDFSSAGVIYFSGSLLAATFVQATEWLAMLSIGATAFVIYSFVYQWMIAKKWCRLCLLVITVLGAQAVLSGFYLYYHPFTDFTILPVLEWAACIALPVVAWFMLLQPLLKKRQKMTTTIFSLLRIKNDASVFLALLQQQAPVPFAPLSGDIQIGNAIAPIQLTVACNPFCHPCAEAHQLLHELAKTGKVGISIRFIANVELRESAVYTMTQYLLNCVAGTMPSTAAGLLHHWFGEMDVTKFREQHPVTTLIDFSNSIKEIQEWSINAGVRFTPTVFVNGYPLPAAYHLSEVRQMIVNEDLFIPARPEPVY